MLVSEEIMEPKAAKAVIDDTWRDTPEDMDIKMTANLPELFDRLKSRDVKVKKHFFVKKRESKVKFCSYAA